MGMGQAKADYVKSQIRWYFQQMFIIPTDFERYSGEDVA